MKKRIYMVIVVAFFGLCLFGQDARAVVKKQRQDKLNPKKIKRLVEQKRQDLEDTQWDIDVKTSAGEKKFTDRLDFKDKKFSSREFILKGFVSAQYSLSVADDGLIVFETMQPGEKGGTIFWKGEFGADDNSLKGIISQVFEDGTTEDLYFSGTKLIETAE